MFPARSLPRLSNRITLIEYYRARSVDMSIGLVIWRNVTSRKLAPTRKATSGSRWIYGDGYIVFHPARRILVSFSHAHREDALSRRATRRNVRRISSIRKKSFDARQRTDWSLEDGARVSVVRQKIVNDVIPRRAYQDYSSELDLRASHNQQVFVATNRWLSRSTGDCCQCAKLMRAHLLGNVLLLLKYVSNESTYYIFQFYLVCVAECYDD